MLMEESTITPRQLAIQALSVALAAEADGLTGTARAFRAIADEAWREADRLERIVGTQVSVCPNDTRELAR